MKNPKATREQTQGFGTAVRQHKLISIVSPCYNEEDSIKECIASIRNIFREHLSDYDYEHIFCDNCSVDRSVEILKEFAAEDPRIKIIVNSRNFGILKNTYNGVMAATGDAVVLFLPVDLQDPPELIVEFVKHWQAGYEVVYGIRGKREEALPLRTARKLYYRILSKLTYVDYPPDVGDYQLIDKRVHQAMLSIDDAQPFMRLMTFYVGFRSKGIPYTWRTRKHGVSRNSLYRMGEQGLNGLISFSNAPVQFALFTGMIVSVLSFLYALVVVVLTLTGLISNLPGIATIVAAIFFFGGLQLFFIGLLGEYVVAIFNQVRRQPLVIERERVNF